MKTKQTYSINALANHTKMDRRTIGRLLKTIPREGGTAARPEWSLKCLEAAGQAAVRANKGSTALKDQKLTEEIRKLKHINDVNAGLLVNKSEVCAAMTRCQYRLREFRFELETLWPCRLVGITDVAAARAECRKIVDRIYEVFRSMSVEFDPLDQPPG